MFNHHVGSRADPLEEPSFSTVGKGEFNQISGHLSSVVAPQEIQHKTLASALGRELQAGGKMASRCPAVWTLSTGPDLLKGGLWPSTGL